MGLLAAQMYTLRNECKTPQDVASACAKIKKMGYDGIQISGICKMEPREMRRILDGEGLSCCATHISLDELESNAGRVIEEHRILGCDYIALGGFFPGPVKCDVWRQFISRFNDVASRFAGSGIRIGYHNHDHEFARIPDSGLLRPIDLLFKELDSSICFEVDVHWVAAGFVSPADFIRQLPGRIPCIHLKDICMVHHEDGVKERKMCEIGDGSLNWPEIFEACRYSMVKWYIVERDDGDLPPFDSLQRSIENLRARFSM